MKDIEELCKDFVNDYFVNDKLRLTPIGVLVIFLFAITFPFYWLYFQIKYLFVKKY